MILDVERVATGGSCVAHAPDGRVVFVRHALPGERVRVQVTDTRRTYLRADAVEILEPSPHRVLPPCPWAGPGRCGGCDWQHADLDEQRRLKAAVVHEQLERLGGVDVAVTVEPVPGDVDGLRWRTRLRLAVDDDGRAGLHPHRSNRVVPIDDCLIAVTAADVPDVVGRSWPPGREVAVDVSGSGERAVSMGTPSERLTEIAAGSEWLVPVGGFWQVHPGAADVLTETVLSALDPQPGETALDLYAGVGLFAGALLGAGASVVAVESGRRAAAAARLNIPDATVRCDRVDHFLAGSAAPGRVDLVVLDPPRSGAGADVVAAVARRRARRIAYVSCDPASLARDVATFRDRGYRLTGLRAFDLFPMTAHVECVATLEPEAEPNPATGPEQAG